MMIALRCAVRGLAVAVLLLVGCGGSDGSPGPADLGSKADTASMSDVARADGAVTDRATSDDVARPPADDAAVPAADAAIQTDGSQGSDGSSSGPDAASAADGAASADDDGDGIPDDREAMLAAAYLPFINVDPNDGCPLGGMLYRVFAHPMDPTLISIIYDHLYQSDCGLAGHNGDDEAFGITVDPTVPPPAGIIAMVAISHQGTFCEVDSSCGKCPGQTACPTVMLNGQSWPVIYSSENKHGSYVSLADCASSLCFDSCSQATAPTTLPLSNAGEPGGHLVENLTTMGFITAANGWTDMSLFNFNPWDASKTFGGAGNIAGDLVDTSFVAAACH